MDHPHWTRISGSSMANAMEETFWRMAREIIFGAFLFRTELENEKVISVSSQPFGARICRSFGVLNTLLAAVLAEKCPDLC